MIETETLHATCVLVGEDAILIRGPSGSGKSTLCREIVAATTAAGRFARLVSDDRTLVENRHGRLLARTHGVTAGLVETRGIGIHAVPYEPAACIRLVVDLVNDAPPRMPEEGAVVNLCGVPLPVLQGTQGRPLAETVLTRLRLIRNPDKDTLVTL